MARTEARLKTSIWEDADYRALTLEAQWLYQAVLTQKDLSPCGVLTWTPKRFAKLASNLTPKTADAALRLLLERRYLVLDDETDELWVRTFLKWDGVLGTPNMVVSMAHAFCAIHSEPIRQGLAEQLTPGYLLGLTGKFKDACSKGLVQRLPLGFRQRFTQPIEQEPSHVPARGGARSPNSLTSSSSSAEPLTPTAAAPPDEDGLTEGARAIEVAVKRRYERADRTRIGSVNGWKRKVREDISTEFAADLARWEADGVTHEQMADWIEPPTAVPPYHEPLGTKAPVWELDDNGVAVRSEAT